MPDREYGGGSYNSGYGSGGFNPRGGDTPGFGTGGGGSVGGGGGYGVNAGGGLGGGGGGDFQSQGRGSNVTDARPQAPAEAAMAVNIPEAMAQGRGSNVTSAFPYNPAESARYGMAPSVQATPPSLALPTFAKYNVSPYTVGVPSIMSAMAPMTISPPTDAMRPTGYMFPDFGRVFQKNDFTPMMGQSSGPTRRGVPESAVKSNLEYTYREPITSFLDKSVILESGGDPMAKSKVSSASGLYQFTKGTWLDTIAKNRPDLLANNSEQEVLDMRFDPVLSTEMARNLAIDNARALRANNIPVTADNLYTSHFLGVNGAIRALKADPTAPVSSVVGEEAAAKNPTMLGERTVADALGTISRKFSAATPKPTPTFMEAGSPADFPAAGGKMASGQQEALGVTFPGGGGQTAAQAASSSPQTFGDWLSGLFDTGARVKELESQGRTSTYPTFGNNNPDADWTAADAKQWYADEFTGGDVSKVKSRIVDFGQGPVVDYYAKDLGDAIFGGLGQGIASLFGGKTEGSTDKNLSDDEYFRKYGRKKGD